MNETIFVPSEKVGAYLSSIGRSHLAKNLGFELERILPTTENVITMLCVCSFILALWMLKEILRFKKIIQFLSKGNRGVFALIICFPMILIAVAMQMHGIEGLAPLGSIGLLSAVTIAIVT